MHNHVWEYTADDAVLTATCHDCIVKDSTDYNVIFTLSAPAAPVYNGTAHTASVTVSPENVLDAPTISYSENGNINAGEVIASITMNGKTASTTYKIIPQTVTPIIAGTISKTYDGNTDVPYPGLAIDLVGVIKGDDVSATANFAYDNSTAGTTQINASDITLSGEDQSNYVLSDTSISANAGKIDMATPAYTVPTNLTASFFDTLADITLPDGFAWQDDLATEIGNEDTYTFKASYTPDDTTNYVVVKDIEITITNGIAISAENFPDAVFRAYIDDNFDTTNDDFLSASELLAVIEINLKENGITTVSDLTGIEYFKGLTALDCSENKLTSLDVSKNAALIALYCSGNT